MQKIATGCYFPPKVCASPVLGLRRCSTLCKDMT